MALLLVSPDRAIAPHQRRPVAGIDLGTTTTAATVRSGQAETLPDHQRYICRRRW